MLEIIYRKWIELLFFTRLNLYSQFYSMIFLFVDDDQAKDVRENPISVRLSKHQARGEESS